MADDHNQTNGSLPADQTISSQSLDPVMDEDSEANTEDILFGQSFAEEDDNEDEDDEDDEEDEDDNLSTNLLSPPQKICTIELTSLISFPPGS